MSNLLEQASLVLIPSGYKEDVVYSEIPLDGSGDMSFTRSSNGTRINSAGLVEVCPWNLLQYSNTFNNGVWVTAGYGNLATLTANSIANPVNGLTDAWTASFAAAGTQGRLLQVFTGLPVGVPYTYSMYVKAGTKTSVSIYSDAASIGLEATFNLSTGVVTSASSGVAATITAMSNGWYYLTITNNILSSGNGQYGIITNPGADGSLYIYGAQLNIGSTAKPYFPTTDRLNVPRLTYQNGGGGCPSLLLEKQSTNLTLYSDQLDNAVHNNIGFTITANNIASPDGTQNADKFTETTVTDEHIIYDIDSNATGTYTLSAFFKGGAGTIFPVLRLNGADSAQYAGCIFNTSTGVVVNTFYNTYSAPATKVENMGNGWYRVSMTTTTTNTNFGMRIASSNSTSPSVGAYGAISYTGSTSNYFYAYGAQLEASSYSTSYIQTTSSSATRVADACFKTGISSLIGQTEGTIFLDFVLNDNLNSNYINIYNNQKDASAVSVVAMQFNGNIFNAQTFKGNGTFDSIQLSASGYGIGQRMKIAYRYKSGDFALYINGVQKGTSSDTMTFNGTKSEIYLQDSTVYFAYQGAVQYNEFVQFPTALSNADLQALTA